MIRSTFHLLSVLALVVTYTHGFTVGHNQQPARVAASTRLFEGAAPVDMEIDMPPTNSGLQANLRLKPVLSVPSEMIEVRYKIPFGLNVEPKNQLAVVTADGPGGEKVGDVLRYTSQWTMGLPKGDGIISTAASFSGGVSWQCTLFNVVNAGSWEQVVEALTSNVEVSLFSLFVILLAIFIQLLIHPIESYRRNRHDFRKAPGTCPRAGISQSKKVEKPKTLLTDKREVQFSFARSFILTQVMSRSYFSYLLA